MRLRGPLLLGMTMAATIAITMSWAIQTNKPTDAQRLTWSVEREDGTLCGGIEDPSTRGYCQYLAVEHLLPRDVAAAESACQAIEVQPWRADCWHLLGERAEGSLEQQLQWCTHIAPVSSMTDDTVANLHTVRQLKGSCVRHVFRRQLHTIPVGEERTAIESLTDTVHATEHESQASLLNSRDLEHQVEMVLRTALGARFESDIRSPQLSLTLCGQLAKPYCAWMVAQGWAHVIDGTKPNSPDVIDIDTIRSHCGAPVPSSSTLQAWGLRGWQPEAEELANLAWSRLCDPETDEIRSLHSVIQDYPSPFEPHAEPRQD